MNVKIKAGLLLQRSSYTLGDVCRFLISTLCPH